MLLTNHLAYEIIVNQTADHYTGKCKLLCHHGVIGRKKLLLRDIRINEFAKYMYLIEILSWLLG